VNAASKSVVAANRHTCEPRPNPDEMKKRLGSHEWDNRIERQRLDVVSDPWKRCRVVGVPRLLVVTEALRRRAQRTREEGARRWD
jgi:hypothetical protein